MIATNLAALPALADTIVTVATLALGAIGGGAVVLLQRRRARRRAPSGRVLLALAGNGVSCAAIDAAARIGRADDAIVVPAALVATPYHLPLDCPLPEAASGALDLLETVEQRLRRAGVEVDPRMVQGRTLRHALRRLTEQERFDRLVVPAADVDGDDGFSADDVGWLLAHVDGEVLVLRPGRDGPSAVAGAAPEPPPVGSRRHVSGSAWTDPDPALPDGGRRRGAAPAGV
jgi:hypothetical protein